MDLDFLSAIKNDNLKKTRRLIDKGVDVNTQNHKGVSGLKIAAYWNHIEIARLLIDMGADVNAEDDDGLTALMCAEQRGHNEIVELLNEDRRLK